MKLNLTLRYLMTVVFFDFFFDFVYHQIFYNAKICSQYVDESINKNQISTVLLDISNYVFWPFILLGSKSLIYNALYIYKDKKKAYEEKNSIYNNNTQKMTIHEYINQYSG